jgi:hypothetical protein
VAKRAYRTSGNAEFADIEEPDLRKRSLADFAHQRQRIRALDLDAEDVARPRTNRKVVIARHFEVATHDLGVELQPVAGERRAHDAKEILFLTKENRISDHVAVVPCQHELFGTLDRTGIEPVDRQLRQQAESAGPAQMQLRHVVGELQQCTALPPRALLISPIGELGRNNGKRIRAEVRPAKQPDRAARVLKNRLETLWGSVARNCHCVFLQEATEEPPRGVRARLRSC